MSKNNENKWVPKLRFPEFTTSNGWDEKPLGSISNRITEKNSDGVIKNVFTNSAIDGIVNQRDFFDKDIADKASLENYYVVKDGDYVYNPRISNIAPVGPISKNKTGKSGAMSPLYTVFRFVDKNNEFYEYYFKTKHWFNAIRKVSNTGARFDRMSITDSVFMNIPVLVPSPKEQQKIAACLSSLDEVITAESQKLALYKEHKKGLLQNLLPQAGETVPKFRFKEFEGSGEWVEKKLGDICKMQAGKFVSAAEINEINSDNLYPCYGGNGLRGYTKCYTNNGKFSLIGRQGALCGNVTLADGKFHATEHAVVVTPKDDIDTVWLYYMLGFLNLNQYATGQAQPGLSVTNLEAVELKVSRSIAEQEKIASTLSSVDDLIIAQNQKLEALQLHKKGLLQGLFPNVNES